MTTLLDRYAWNARLLPAFIVLLPVALVALAREPKVTDLVKPVLSVVVGAGCLVLLAHIARSAGQKAGERLIAEWGGLPSTIMLRHRDTGIDSETKRRYHMRLGKLVPNVRMPTPDEEATDQQQADCVYEACRTFLLSKTRDQKKFALLFNENVAYGFRRNLFGLRLFGILVSIGGVAGSSWKIVTDVRSGESAPTLAVLAFIICVGLLYAWLAMVNKEWVRRGANDYAVRLLETIDLLAEKPEGKASGEHRQTSKEKGLSPKNE
jgi:hypothetical protein